MKHLNVFLMLIALFSWPLTAQDFYHYQATVSKESMLSVSWLYTFPPALSVRRQFPSGGEVDLIGNALTGVEGGIAFTRQLRKNFGFYLGGLVGAFPNGYTLHLTPEFGIPFSRRPIEVTSSTTYFGVQAGWEFFINPEKKRFLSAGAGVRAVYFPSSGPEPNGFFVVSNTGSTTFFPETEFYVNPENKLIWAPEVSLRFYHRLGRRLLAHAGAMGTYARQKPIVAEKFVFKSDTQTLEGSYAKQFAYPAIELGVSMRFKRVAD